MGLPSMGGGRPTLPNEGAPAPQGAPPMGGAGGGGNIRAELQQLHASLPPEAQHLLDPGNPITALMYKRLRDDLSDEEGQAILNLFGNADQMALAAAKKVWPEIMLLLDIFDDGEVNDSVGTVPAGGAPAGFDGGAGGGAPPMGGGGPSAPRPPSEAPDDDFEEDEEAQPRSRLRSIMG